MNKEEAKQKVNELIDRFRDIMQSGQFKKYSEEQTKKDFILPLFEILGWDVYGKDVSAEENISGKRVDYGFYLNERTQFYLEAKAVKEDLDKEEFANQAIKYSWNKGVTWAILTNFKNIKIFNAQDIEEALWSRQFKSLAYTEFIDRFDELWLLSKESFRENQLDIIAEKSGKKLQKISVTKKLYEDLNEARALLTKRFLDVNPDLNKIPHLVDEGVQKILDRIIFIRVAEDRGIEPATLKPLVRDYYAKNTRAKKFLYQSMIDKFNELDDIYNSQIFAPHPSDHWQEFTDIVEEIIEKLYGKKGYYEYDFKVMSADVLGTVYEQYLGYKLAKASKKDLFGNSDIELEKDLKKRKQQGIYYTPSFIVDYIVKNALGPVLDKCKSITDLQKIKVLDPACGSGSFLIKAFDLIRKKYEEFGSYGQYINLQILTSNLYGVDLDEQAVEIARLNLLIAALEKREKLPNLTNIKNGNSLISESKDRTKKPFDWQEEFPDVFKQNGFDVIIGNPPYIKEFVNKNAFDDLHNNPYYQGKMDLWTMFACVSVDLLKENGVLGFIAPNNWVTNAGASIMRNKILTDGELKTFIDFGDYKVFEEAGIQTMIFVFEKKKPNKKYNIDYLKINDKNITEEKLIAALVNKKTKIEIEPEKLVDKNITFANQESGSIFDKIESKKNFELTEKEVGQGIVAAPDKYFLEKDIGSYNKNEQTFLKPFFTSAGRYKSGESENYIFYMSDKNFGDKKLKDYPNIEEHFKPFEKVLKEAKEKYGTPNKPYFYLHREREEMFFNQGPKIICGVRVVYPSFYYTKDPYYGSRALNFVKTDRINLKYLSGILNSKVSYFWLKNKGKQLGDLLQIDKGPLLEIPICVGDEKQQKVIIDLVDEITSLNKKFHKLPENSNDWIKMKEEIERTDKKIDEEVYKLYGLTDEEIKIIENKK